MKEKILTGICVFLLLVPWTIFPLRTFPWALESPAAEIIITCYALVMAASCVVTLAAYCAGNAKNLLMKICCVVSTLYGVFGVMVLGMIYLM